MHGLEPGHHCLHECLSIWFWAVVLPLTGAVVAVIAPEIVLAILAAYPVHLLRIYCRKRRLEYSSRDALLYSAFCILGKFPMGLGGCVYLGLWSGRRARRIDYKSV